MQQARVNAALRILEATGHEVNVLWCSERDGMKTERYEIIGVDGRRQICTADSLPLFARDAAEQQQSQMVH